MSLHIFMVITSMHIWCSIITVNTQQSWQIAWSRIQILQVKTGRKDINSSASWLPQRLIIPPPFPGSFGGSLCPGCHQGTITFISTRDVAEMGPYSNTTYFYSRFLHSIAVWCRLCRRSGCQAPIEPQRQVGSEGVFGALRKGNCPGKCGEIQRKCRSAFISCRNWSLMDRNSGDNEYHRSSALPVARCQSLSHFFHSVNSWRAGMCLNSPAPRIECWVFHGEALISPICIKHCVH